MSGTGLSQIRSASVAEVTGGLTPSTPAFKTQHSPIKMVAKPDIIQGRSLLAGGGRLGQGINGIDVSGSLESPLIYGVFDDFIATLLQSAWAADAIKDGKAASTVSVENTIPAGNGGAATYLRYRGVEATSATLSLKAKNAASISFDLFGIGSDDATTTAITGATYADPTEADPLASGADVGAIVFDGYSLDCMEALDIVFGFENRDPQPKISSNDYCGVTRGDFMPVLTANMYVEANFAAIYNASRARHATFAVTVPIGSVTGEKYLLTFPACNFGSTELDLSGANVMQKIEITPQYDATSGATMTMTRAVA